MGRVNKRVFSFFLFHWASIFLLAEPGVAASLRTSFGRTFSNEEPATSVSFEPSFTKFISISDSLNFYTLVDRPLDSHLNFTMPQAILSYRHTLASSTLRGYANAVDVDRWSLEGPSVRLGASVDWAAVPLPQLTVGLRAGPYVQLNQFAQRQDGNTLTRYGFLERVTVVVKRGKLTLDLQLLLEQKLQTVWENNYSTSERLSYQVTDNLALGVGHELVSSLLDDSTGYARPIRFGDNRESRVSFFAEVRI